MRSSRALWMLCAAGLAGGCMSPVTGTWKADGSSESPSPIASASFCPDGTFTAEAQYNGTTRAMSGHYTLIDGTIKLEMEGMTREYGVSVEGDTLTMTHDGKPARMMRVKPR